MTTPAPKPVKAAKKKHAKYSPSSADRWTACAGSIAMSEKAVERFGTPPEGPYAKEGTEAHKALEILIKNAPGTNASKFIRDTYGTQMAEHAESAKRAIWKLAPKGAKIHAESEADLRFIDKDFYGTADVTIAEDFGRLTVIDYKYGAGIFVEVEDNPQLIAYALAKAHEYDYNFEEINIVVIQPRAPDGQGKFVREWLTDVGTLIEWERKFKKAIAATKAKNPPLVSGDHCRFCPGKMICPEQSTRAFKAAQIEFDDEDGTPNLPMVSKTDLALDPKKLGATLDACEKIESWIGEVRKHAFMVLSRGGTPVPGWKLAERRSTRRWTDPAQVLRLAKKKYGAKALTEPELLSPAQLEKIAGKEWVNKFSSAVSSGMTLVKASDPRPETNRVQTDFDDDV